MKTGLEIVDVVDEFADPDWNDGWPSYSGSESDNLEDVDYYLQGIEGRIRLSPSELEIYLGCPSLLPPILLTDESNLRGLKTRLGLAHINAAMTPSGGSTG